VKGYRELQRAADANGTTIAELRESHTTRGEGQQKFKDFAPKVREHLAKSIHYRRLAAKRLRDAGAVTTLFDEIAPRYLERPGGYLRVLRTSRRRLGDGADEAMLGFVQQEQAAAAS